jgi:parallel beta-helix repeat protein
MKSRFAHPAVVAGIAALALYSSHSQAACTISISTDAQIAPPQTFASVAPGSTICIAPGTYNNQLTIYQTGTGTPTGPGTAAQPVNFIVSPNTGPARFTRGVLLRHVQYVNISGLSVSLDPTKFQYGAVILDTGTRNSTVSGSTVQNSYLGIAIGNGSAPAGNGNSITNNIVQNNWNTGIGVAPLSDGTSATYNYIQNNSVLNNGGHGIETSDANYIAIAGNTVQGNGTGVNSASAGGYSGIHIYASAATSASSPNGARCVGNLVGFNTVIGTLERAANSGCHDSTGAVCGDGNGVQIDHYCSYNTVYGNSVSANAGSGISIYGASNNSVYSNSAYGNNKQVARTNFGSGYGEFVVSAVNLATGSAANNAVYNNLAITTTNKIPAFFLSANAGSNTIGPNNTWWWNGLAAPDSSWGPASIGATWYSVSASFNQAVGTTGNIVGAPPQ